MENKIKKAETEAKIKSLKKDLIELQKTKSLALTAFCVGVTKMENSLTEKLIELNKELNSSNLKEASLDNRKATAEAIRKKTYNHGGTTNE